MSKYPVYDREQLQKKAEAFLCSYRPDLLERPALDFDVYDVVENCLHVDVDWQYLSPDESVLGMTAFESGSLKVYTDEGVFPHRETMQIFVNEGTILIERALSEDESRRGQENFTVMHEVFHALLHREYFQSLPEMARIEHQNAKPQDLPNGQRKLETPMDFIEWQADTCAACFLMPETAVRRGFQGMKRKFQHIMPQDQWLQGALRILADAFHVSRQAMKYRLKDLHLICTDE